VSTATCGVPWGEKFIKYLWITYIRKLLPQYKKSFGLNNKKTLDCMILLADKLKEFILFFPDKKEFFNDEIVSLYQCIIDNSLNSKITIKTKIKLASIQYAIYRYPHGCPSFFRDLINEVTKSFGENSEELFQCVDYYLRSDLYDKSDINYLYDFFELAKNHNHDFYCGNFPDLLEENGFLNKALKIFIYEFEKITKYQPIWLTYSQNLIPENISRLYILLNDPKGLLDFLIIIRDSFLEIPSLNTNPDELYYGYKEAVDAFNSAISELENIINPKTDFEEDRLVREG
jgi:hypothetical protein